MHLKPHQAIYSKCGMGLLPLQDVLLFVLWGELLQRIRFHVFQGPHSAFLVKEGDFLPGFRGEGSRFPACLGAQQLKKLGRMILVGGDGHRVPHRAAERAIDFLPSREYAMLLTAVLDPQGGCVIVSPLVMLLSVMC